MKRTCRNASAGSVYILTYIPKGLIRLGNTPAEGVQNVFYIVIGKSGVKGECQLVFVHIVSIGIIFDVKAELLVSCEQGQGLEMYITDNTILSHSLEESIAVFFAFACKTNKVEVTAAAMILASVVKHGYGKISKSLVVALDEFVTTCKHLLVTVKLSKTQSRENIGHIALVLSFYNVVLPGCTLVFCVSILGLSVEGKEHILAVKLIVVDTVKATPCNSTTLTCCEVLNSMEAEVCKVCCFCFTIGFI